ncbi:MAG TPA: Wzy polymerase domain-containing protein, partial [Ramlibacter sp.]|nr:Wzy polymerase domain-containing protein [Ramlibacter sp.]
KPWTGWGWGELDFAHFMTLYPGDRFCDILDNAHNLPLHLAVELGVPAALAVVVATAVLVWRARPWQETDPQRQFAWAVLALIGLHSLVEYPLWYGPFQLAAVVCVALLLPVRPPGIRARIACVVLALVGLASLASVHALYDRVSDAYRLPAQRRPELRQDPVTPLGRPPLFDAQVRFAELSITELSPANARHVHQLAQEVLHYSPEARVVEKLIESATLLGHTDEAVAHLARFKAAFPQRYAQWAGTPRTSGPGTAAPQR